LPRKRVIRPWRRTIAYVLLAFACAAPSAAAQDADTGGFSPDAATQPAAMRVAAPPGADLYGSPAPRVTRLACRRGCVAAATARPGSLVRVYGTGLGNLGEVLFFGVETDESDDAAVAPRRVGRRSVLVRVPRTAVTGRLGLRRVDGTRSPASRQTLTVAPAAAALPAGVVEAEVQEHKVFFGARKPASLSYVVGGSRSASVQVQLLRGRDGAVVTSWSAARVEPGVPQTLEWDGTVDGEVQAEGLYRFQVTATDTAGVRATSSQAAAPVDGETPDAFRFLAYRFPIMGAHSYGEFAASFGGGRGHQGQDVFATCGTPLVAARGGTVKFTQFQSRAGHYVVIDGARTGVDYAYMHLREAALVEKGDKVMTGQLIGYVGDTGRASGCHLHFEEWSAPGWYTGGSPFDPLPDLKAWDAES
jgi:murein DD-endopeptidase MepM/ murein hydrolase activator NlpD